MNEAAEELYEFLRDNATVNDVMGDNPVRVYPFVAPEGVAKPFMIYSVGSDSVAKGHRQCNALVSAYFDGNQATEMLQFISALGDLFDDTLAYETGPIETGYSERYDTMVANLNINIY